MQIITYYTRKRTLPKPQLNNRDVIDNTLNDPRKYIQNNYTIVSTATKENGNSTNTNLKHLATYKHISKDIETYKTVKIHHLLQQNNS